MSTDFDLGPVERVTASAVGEPGDRMFCIQARAGATLMTLLAEKEQVRALGLTLVQLLEQMPDGAEGAPVSPGDLELEQPVVPEWRSGQMAVAYDDQADLITLMIDEAVAEEDEPGATARLQLTRAQARAVAEHAEEIVAAGRPRCRSCGYPLGDGDHICPAMNGHGRANNN